MSKENAIQFLKQLRENEIAEQKMKRKGKFEDSKSMAQALSEVASEMGKEISPEDFAKALEVYENEMRQRTDSVISGIEALKDEELENVAGGKKDKYFLYGRWTCKHTQDGNACWLDDACNVSRFYYYCNGNYNAIDCTVFNFCERHFEEMV